MFLSRQNFGAHSKIFFPLSFFFFAPITRQDPNHRVLDPGLASDLVNLAP